MIVSRTPSAGPRGLTRRVLATVVLPLALVGCKKADGIECTPPPANLTCSDAAPSFASDVYPNVFVPVCVTCHSPEGVEPSMPFTNYQQIYGSNGTEAKEIFNQVFESCLMPPAGAAVSLTEDQRQTLLDWFACGAQDSAAFDGGSSD
jgi:uncharacterized membrane protein